jgi:hypothetical protein
MNVLRQSDVSFSCYGGRHVPCSSQLFYWYPIGIQKANTTVEFPTGT